MNQLSNLVGDDRASRRIRLALLRGLGAQIGAGSSFHGGTYFSAPRRLRVGSHCFVNRSCYFDLGSTVWIGDEVVIGHGTTIITTHHRVQSTHRRAGAPYGRPVVIESGAWIGANVILMPGVTVRRGAVVGAGALVLHDVPRDTVVAGVPAHEIRSLVRYGDPSIEEPTGDGGTSRRDYRR
ncbi:MAG: acyltransferase [Actinomycetota bacterium]|nr:acyltransferase [Actinomycetota bacterium]